MVHKYELDQVELDCFGTRKALRVLEIKPGLSLSEWHPIAIHGWMLCSVPK